MNEVDLYYRNDATLDCKKIKEGGPRCQLINYNHMHYFSIFIIDICSLVYDRGEVKGQHLPIKRAFYSNFDLHKKSIIPERTGGIYFVPISFCDAAKWN